MASCLDWVQSLKCTDSYLCMLMNSMVHRMPNIGLMIGRKVLLDVFFKKRWIEASLIYLTISYWNNLKEEFCKLWKLFSQVDIGRRLKPSWGNYNDSDSEETDRMTLKNLKIKLCIMEKIIKFQFNDF